MHRFYVSPEHWNPDHLILTEGEAHHARDVLRLKSGDKAVLFNGRGREVTAEIIDASNKELRFRKLTETETPPLKCRITLGQAIPKGKNMDLIVQKAVEIGVAEICPLISQRTVVDLDPDAASLKQTKWQQIAIEAAKQCGQNWLPQVRGPQTLKNFFGEEGVAVVAAATTESKNRRLTQPPLQHFDLQLIGSLQPDAQHLKKILAHYTEEHANRPSSVLMLVGPEGDFTPAELALAKSHGCLPITLGPIILKVETAAIYCLSVLSYELF
ncbi:MAG TPA: 16S rRNA (uracil(1498)-N(3))-methyltransferase [Chthoniobacterales bacterium]|jgi:16S rRNA (uracil1498-N3)-methyltransferase